MANELSITAAFSYAKNGIQAIGRAVTALLVSVTGSGSVYNPGFPVSTVDTTLPLGGIATPLGFCWLHNLDAVNNINIKTAVGGTIMVTLLPGEAAMFRFGAGVTAPSVASLAGTPLLEYEIFPA